MDLTRRGFLATCAMALATSAVVRADEIVEPQIDARDRIRHGEIGRVRFVSVEFARGHESARAVAVADALDACGLTQDPIRVSFLGEAVMSGAPSNETIMTLHFPGRVSVVVAPSDAPRPTLVRGTSGSVELPIATGSPSRAA